MYSENAPAAVDPYSDAYIAPPPAAATSDSRERDPPPPRGRSRSRSPVQAGSYRSPPPSSYGRPKSPPPKRPSHAPNPNPSNVLGVFGLSIRTTERDLDDEFGRFGRVEKVTIVYDQRSDRSRGFGFIRMATVEDASRCVQELNGLDLNGRRIRVDYSVTDRPHAPTPGEYMGHRRSGGGYRDSRRDSGRDSGRDSYRDRDSRRDYDRHDRDRYERDRSDRDRDRDRDPYGRDSRDWKDRRSPPPSRSRHSPARSRRSYSRSPPRVAGSGSRSGREYDGATSAAPANGERW